MGKIGKKHGTERGIQSRARGKVLNIIQAAVN